MQFLNVILLCTSKSWNLYNHLVFVEHSCDDVIERLIFKIVSFFTFLDTYIDTDCQKSLLFRVQILLSYENSPDWDTQNK